MEIVKLNVGGKQFATLKSTLLKHENSYFAYVLNSKDKSDVIYDENKAIFIDRNPKYFEFIIEYLRTGFMEALPKDYYSLKRLTDEALYYKLGKLSQEIYLTYLPTTILTEDTAPISLLFNLSDFFIKKWYLVYRGSRDGFEPSSFHEKCDTLKNSLIIAKSTKNFVFGGYTNASWSSNPLNGPSVMQAENRVRRQSLTNSGSEFKKDPDAFIFSLVNTYKKPFLMKCINVDKAIYADQRCGPVFGNNDINLLDNSSYLAYEGSSKVDRLLTKIKNYSNVGQNYQLPDECDDAHFLANSKNFELAELEVFTASIL